MSRVARQNLDVDGLSLENLNRLVLELGVDPSSTRLVALETSDCRCGVCYSDPRLTLQWDFYYVPDPPFEVRRFAANDGEWIPDGITDPDMLDLPEEPIR